MNRKIFPIISGKYGRSVMIEITNILGQLSQERPIFHSERDFQHALAWKIHTIYPGIEMRLERRVDVLDGEPHLDIFAVLEHSKIFAMEVKFKPKKFKIKLPNTKGLGEEYNLKGNQARNHDRYDFINDISRLEKVLKKYPNGVGFAIFLTNDESYWDETKSKRKTSDENFRIYGGRVIEGKLRWKKGFAKGTTKGPEIKLDGKYRLNWKDYSDLEKYSTEKNGHTFRYLLVKVTKRNRNSP